MINSERSVINSSLRKRGITDIEATKLLKKENPSRDQVDELLIYLAKCYFNEAGLADEEVATLLVGDTFPSALDSSRLDDQVSETLRVARAAAQSGAPSPDLASMIVARLGGEESRRGGVALYYRVILARLRDDHVHPYVAARMLWWAGLQEDVDYHGCIHAGKALAVQWQENLNTRGDVETRIRDLTKWLSWE
ncbi:hypothetical protein Srot_2990 [Segniliparus rotundus DSM 44985]|uniref:Uncharacterized protein n=1 Tax=Segniliparus rotundus (strain ATCC BAA-972 / CDC 1076 / CIP 108378 / DSM 44985 / JCM 13578) TaxID=640132 RepID=D6ZEE2_SEGRD|nr:hypothetical protein [Segniliparus rotundus]ADG99418.1 hypothetical protein Srot_2990 [Segniliparus rotundus DSM 44985]